MNGRAACVGVALLIGTGCGGGGGDDDIRVTFNPSALQLCCHVDQSQYAGGNAWATLSEVPADVARVNVVVSSAALNPNALSVEQVGANLFQVAVGVAAGLPLGTHEGTLSFELCRDQACSSRHALSGATLPFRVNVVATGAACP
jgi:hypothetical protein